MRKTFLPLLISSSMVLFACNDQSASDGSENSADTMAMQDTAAASNPVVTNTLNLTGAEEVPANQTTGSGTANVTYNKDSKTLIYTLNWSGLTGPATMAHIHGTAARGANAGPRRDLTDKIQKAASGSFSDTVMVDGNEIKEDSLLQGFYYFNIHTKANPGGEIRAQIQF